jgi:uncharacterized membrane protein YGL010W
LTTTLHAQIEFYRSQHRTKGCELCHLIGVPLIAASIFTLPFNFRGGLKLFTLGWGLQFIGHFVFEKNKPVLFSEARDPLTVLAALIYVSDGWSRLLSGRSLVDRMESRSSLRRMITDGDGRGSR